MTFSDGFGAVMVLYGRHAFYMKNNLDIYKVTVKALLLHPWNWNLAKNFSDDRC